MPLTRCGEEPTIAGVADKLLIALLEFRAQTVDDGCPHRGVALRLLGVEANHIAAWLCYRILAQ